MDYQSKIIIDATRALKDLKVLDKVLKSNQKSMDAVTRSASQLDKTLKLNSKNVKMLTTQVKHLTAATKSNSAATKLLTTQTKNLNVAVTKNTASIYKNTAALKTSATTMNHLATAVNKSVTGMKLLATQTSKLAANVAKNNTNLVALSQTMKNLSTATNASALAIRTFNANSAILNASMTANTIALSKMTAQMSILGASLNRNTAAMTAYRNVTVSTTASQTKLSHSISLVNSFLRLQLVLFRTAMLAASAFAAAKLYIAFNKTAESIDLMGKKLYTFTKNAAALDIVKASAFKTGFAIGDLGKIVTRFAITTEGAFSTNTLVKWTEGLIMSGRAAGTSTMELNNALIQLSQSFSAGFLMGDEYRSISENLPLFKMALREVADEAGYAGKALKEMSSERLIDVEMMTKGLELLSKKAMEYTFALDNIEAAEQRVKIGWELWANAVADSRALKDSLNTLSGIMVGLANDGASMVMLEDNFPEISGNAQDLSMDLLDLYDTLVRMDEAWMNLAAEMAEDPLIGKHIAEFARDLESVGNDLQKLPIDISYFFDVMRSNMSTIDGFVDGHVNKIKAHFGRFIDYMKHAWYLAVEKVESFFTNMINKALELLSGGMKKMGNILTNFSATREIGEGLLSASSSMDKIIGKQITVLELQEKWGQAELDSKNDYEDKLALYDKQIYSALRLGQIEITNAKINSNNKKIAYDQQSALDRMNRRIARRVAMETARETLRLAKLEENKGLDKKPDSKAIAAYNKAVNKAEKDLLKFIASQREIEREIFDLENPFNMIFDSSDNVSQMEKNVKALDDALRVHLITQEEYNDLKKLTISSTEKLNELEQSNVYEEKAREYDEVKAAAYDLLEAQTELKNLTEGATISEYARIKSLYEKERALIVVQAKAGEISQADQAFSGLIDGMQQFGYESETVFETISGITNDLFQGMTEQLAQFVETGKLDFNSLIDSMIADILRLAIQEAITKPLAGALVSGLGSMFGNTATAATYGTDIGSTQTSMLYAQDSQWAKGGIFNSGNVVPFADGGVISKPTLFPMSNGAGLMGEAGPEAIMPLSRDSDGKLGVKGGGSKTVVNIINNGSGDEVTQTSRTNGNIETIDIFIEKKINSAMGNGSVDKSMGKNYSGRRRGY